MKNPFTEGNSITKVTRNEKRMKRNPASTPRETIGFRISAGPRKGEGEFYSAVSRSANFLLSRVCSGENYTYRKEGEATGLPVVSRALVNARRYPHPPIQGWNVRVCTTRRG